MALDFFIYGTPAVVWMTGERENEGTNGVLN